MSKFKPGDLIRISDDYAGGWGRGQVLTVKRVLPLTNGWAVVCKTAVSENHFIDDRFALPGEGAKQEPSPRIVQCPKCNHKSPGGTIHEKNCGVPVDPLPVPHALHVFALEIGAETIEKIVVPRRDMDGKYGWCRRCRTDVWRGAGRYFREMPHAHGCDLAPALGKATRSRP